MHERRLGTIEYRNEVFESGINELALHDEMTRDTLENIEQQLIIGEAERLNEYLELLA